LPGADPSQAPCRRDATRFEDLLDPDGPDTGQRSECIGDAHPCEGRIGIGSLEEVTESDLA
jgi:hypothetical protein